jgi:F0F1-type ATP synthase assembly protein I
MIDIIIAVVVGLILGWMTCDIADYIEKKANERK